MLWLAGSALWGLAPNDVAATHINHLLSDTTAKTTASLVRT